MINKIAKFFGLVVLKDSEYNELNEFKKEAKSLNKFLMDKSSEICKIRGENFKLKQEINYIKMEYISNPYFDKEVAEELQAANEKLFSARSALTYVLYNGINIRLINPDKYNYSTPKFEAIRVYNGVSKDEQILYGSWESHADELGKALANYRTIHVDEK